MAMFLSRIKKALNLGTKNITVNGTYNASSDGYDGYSSVEVNVAGVTPTPVTPSNATPAALTSGSAVSPTANGYAIESYNTKTPSNSSPVALASGEIDKIGGNGYAIESYSEVSASYTQDVPLTLGNIYKATSSGKFVPDVININPTNASPVTLSYPRIYRNIAEYGGVAIGGFVDKTPSDDNPPALVSGAIYRVSAAGYLYSTQQPKVKTGTVTLSTSSTTKITCGFEPKYIAVITYKDSTHYNMNIYNKDVSTSYTYRGSINGTSTAAGANAFPASSSQTLAGLIMSTDSTGFTLNKSTTTHGNDCYYFAIG